MFKSVLVGCGYRAHAHVEAYKHLPSAKVTACCGLDEEQTNAFAAKYGLVAYADAREMIEREKPDLVHLATWPNTRVELTSLVSDLGVPLCTVEKPIATGVADWRELKALSRATRTKFAVCHQFRWQSDLSRCQNAVKTGLIGAPILLHMSAGMNIAGQGTHTLNYGRSLVGDPAVTRVFANASGWDTTDPGHPAPETTVAQLEFDTGLRGLWTSGIVSPRAGDPEVVWQHVRVAAYAELGRVVYEEFGKWEIVGPGANERGDFGSMESYAANAQLAQAGFHQSMFDWLGDEGKEPGTSLSQSLHEWEVVLGVYLSALERRPVEIGSTEFPDDLIARYREEASKSSISQGCSI